jgi:hypothetical protein
MYKAFETYKNMFKHTVIAEAEETEKTEELDVEVEKEDEKPTKAPAVKETEISTEEADMKFSVDLATEFSNTINEFTNICAKMVEKRIINKEMSDRFYDLYSKIKNLADAASKTK